MESGWSLPKETLLEMQRRMLRIRLFDERASRMVKRGYIPGTVHTSIGQEAQVVGACMALVSGDKITGNHRSHGHPIGMGSPLGPLMAELVGKATGVCKGKGGSLHLADYAVGSLGESGITASSIPIAMGAGLSVLSELVVFRRFRRASPATMMIASFALGFVIRYFLLMLFSSRPKSISLLPALSQPVEIFGARIPLLQVITIIVTIAILFGLTAFLKRTRYGLEMRAAAENFTMARMLGVRANRVIMGAFALSGALAAAIGLILVAQTGTADIQMGGAVMLMAFIATVIGGLGSLPGAVLAGFLLGAASVVMQVVLPADARPFRDAFVYGAVILVLIWRPQGLLTALGTKERV